MSTKPKDESGLANLRKPFTGSQISKLPKETRKQIDERKNNSSVLVNCKICGGWHHKNAVHLDYVGHAALTDRLLDTDIEWSWEPLAFTPDGLPAFDRTNGLWIKLTVCGVTRLGYGSADGKSGGDAVKDIIGDALRNAAMRFGAALDLWHKGDLHSEDGEEFAGGNGAPVEQDNAHPPADPKPITGLTDAQFAQLSTLIETAKADTKAICDFYRIASIKEMTPEMFKHAVQAAHDKIAQNTRKAA